MHYQSFFALFVSSFLLIARAAVIVPRAAPSQPTLTDVWRFPKGTWAENMAVRSNGQLLVTFITPPDLYLVDPVAPNPQLIHRFPQAASLLGIAEVEKDVFAVVAGNFSVKTLASTPGS
jgi:hypothetical protein